MVTALKFPQVGEITSVCASVPDSRNTLALVYTSLAWRRRSRKPESRFIKNTLTLVLPQFFFSDSAGFLLKHVTAAWCENCELRYKQTSQGKEQSSNMNQVQIRRSLSSLIGCWSSACSRAT